MFLGYFTAALSLATLGTAFPRVHGDSHLHRRQAGNDTGYEYVIVGSGPGGGPLAARLAIAGHRVLLIEAGGDFGDNVNQTVPARNLQSGEDPNIKWDYFVTHYKDVERQKKDIKMTYRLSDGSFYHGLYPPEGAEPLGILYPRASALGGCAEHNAVVTTYPHKSDWTYLQTLTGDDSWAPEKMREYFKKLEHAQYPVGPGHGKDGWFHTSLTELTLVAADFKVLSIVLSAASALGKSDLISTVLNTVTGLANVLLTDLNADTPDRDQQEDLFQIPQGIDAGSSTRSTPRKLILDTANAVNEDGSRKYVLDIKLNTLATKVRFDNSTKPRAIGVEYLEGKQLYGASAYPTSGGRPGYVAAGKEVIIAGGTFNTPQLLKLSGVGPREELERFGIPVVHDLPGVGTNMQDRYEIAIVGQAETKLSISKDCTFGYESTDPCLDRWQEGNSAFARGPYATGGVAVGVTKKSSGASEDEDPDLFIIGAPGLFGGYYPGFAYDAVRPGNIWSWLALKAHSHNNAGTVTLRSADPHDVPQIDFNSFDTGNTTDGGDEKDLQAATEGLMFGREAFDKLIPLDGTFTEIQPGRNVTGEDGLKEWARNNAWGHHACCSAPIGADGDPMAVLDTNFRVRGVDGLRVVDASAFPKIPGTFIALPIYMISEKAADVIINGD
ncbi:hypothetical protein CKM354_000002600 [Cercospora kikuchii]|uniref:Glucose-methanol-choline oxidoreductase N-terminal domain-containing protein n=1 Tax=Cercospora kikuchii TaxID=84275 RepID=A0A9P3FBG3_9PEZI|nr:uncharacterized protein CKM354_000002600 [Cercospora kikuchii]GIZ36555.1 hypothetical protein CKM354_000002600 [Cercospora kikuchii]